MLSSIRNLLYVLRRFKMASILNLLGLTVAFTAFMVVIMHVKFEYGYDQFHKNKEEIYRAENCRTTDQRWESNFARPTIEYLLNNSPHVKAYGLWQPINMMTLYITTDLEGNAPGFREHLDRITPGFTDVFHFDMMEGEAKSIENPNQVLIPLSLARKYFGGEPAVGKILYLAELGKENKDVQLAWGASVSTQLVVGGVYRDFPENSQLPNRILSGIAPEEMMEDWNTGLYYAFLRWDEPGTTEALTREFSEQYQDQLKKLGISEMRFRPLTDLYFGERVRYDHIKTGNKTTTDILLAVAFLIMLIAAINYINFSVALTPMRIKSINTRKVLGSTDGRLRRQLVGESLSITGLAFLLALCCLWVIEEAGLLTNLFPNSFSLTANFSLVIYTALLALGLGVLAGLYPAWHMTSFPPALALNGSFAATGRAKFVRKSLIGFQYVVSIALIVGAFFIHIQNQYVGKVDLGFNKNHILVVPLSMDMGHRYTERYKQELLTHAGIQEVAFTQQTFVTDDNKPSYGAFHKGKHFFTYGVSVSHNFPQMIGIEVSDGRNFQQNDEYASNSKVTWIFNETAARNLEMQAGDSIRVHGTNDLVAGIFPDVHFESLYRPMEQMAFRVSTPDRWDPFGMPLSVSYIKLAPGNPAEAMKHIRKTLHEIDPSFPVEMKFFDQHLNELYEKSHNQGVLITLFSMLAVLLSIVGVFGLVVFEAQGRAKEIAVRKVMGATVQEILAMFNTGFVKIVLVCFVVAAPLAWFGINRWLNNFAYKTPLHIWVFGVALFLVLLLTVLTVTFQSFRAATANPARSLQKG